MQPYPRGFDRVGVDLYKALVMLPAVLSYSRLRLTLRRKSEHPPPLTGVVDSRQVDAVELIDRCTMPSRARREQ